MEKLESDLKRLVQNAKEFNSTKSEVYEDAERIRKALSNFMPKHNPAYLDPAYRAYPTPVPGFSSDSRRDSTFTPAREVNGNADSLKIKLTNMGSRRKSNAQPTDEDDGPEDDMISKQIDLIDQMMELPNAEYDPLPCSLATPDLTTAVLEIFTKSHRSASTRTTISSYSVQHHSQTSENKSRKAVSRHGIAL